LNLEDTNLDLNDTWCKLMKAVEQKHSLGAICQRNDIEDKTRFTKVGLSQPHGYYILDVKEFEGNRLIKLKNPLVNNQF
jgi:hypothetical protein